MKKWLIVLLLAILIGVLALEVVTFLNIVELDKTLPSVEDIQY